MFDITSSKLLILAIVALIVVGPKDLPILLRTVAKYLGVIRRHANEFRAQLDDALREVELDELKKEFDSVGQEMKEVVEKGGRAIDSDVDRALKDKKVSDGPRVIANQSPKAGMSDDVAPPEEPQLPEKTGT
jgi:sec-independent protein translocase protein TatB